LGVMYQGGFGISQDYKMAAKWYARAADPDSHGFAMAQSNLGVLYEKGLGIKPNADLAFYYYQLSANQGYGLGEFNLGVAYENGIGTTPNTKAAIKWYTRSAKHGCEKSLYALGKMHWDGIGTRRNLHKGLELIEKAAKLGYEKAEAKLKMISRSVPTESHLDNISHVHPDSIKYELDPDTKTRISAGSCVLGKSYLASFRGTLVAVRVLPKVNSTGEDRIEFVREAYLLQNIRHPNIITFMGDNQESTELGMLWYLTAYPERGPLSGLIKSRAWSVEWGNLGRHIALDTARALCFLHQSGYVHLDVASHNILISAGGTAKLSAFHMCYDVQSMVKMRNKEKPKPRNGSIPWAAPEFILGRKISQKADVYSLAIVLFEIIMQKLPWVGYDVEDIKRFVTEGECVGNSNMMPMGVADTWEKMLSTKPSHRLDSQDVVLSLESYNKRWDETLSQQRDHGPTMLERYKDMDANPS